VDYSLACFFFLFKNVCFPGLLLFLHPLYIQNIRCTSFSSLFILSIFFFFVFVSFYYFFFFFGYLIVKSLPAFRPNPRGGCTVTSTVSGERCFFDGIKSVYSRYVFLATPVGVYVCLLLFERSFFFFFFCLRTYCQ
jgi:hypothetical protein